MRMNALLAATAIAAAAVGGSVHAAENFAALDGIPAEALSANEMEAVVGEGISIDYTPASFGSLSLLGSFSSFSFALGVHWENPVDAIAGFPSLSLGDAVVLNPGKSGVGVFINRNSPHRVTTAH